MPAAADADAASRVDVPSAKPPAAKSTTIGTAATVACLGPAPTHVVTAAVGPAVTAIAVNTTNINSASSIGARPFVSSIAIVCFF